MYRLIAFLLLSSQCLGYKIFDSMDNDEEEIVEIERNIVDSRFRRSGKNMFPEDIEYKFLIRGDPKHLKLKKNNLLGIEAPLYRMFKGKPLEESKMHDKQYAAYQDPETGASILLHCHDEDSCKMYGTVFHGGEHFRIQPDSAAMSSRKHRIRKLKQRFNLERDILKFGGHGRDNDTLKYREIRDTGVKHHVVELMMFLDDSVYKFFLKMKMNNYGEDEALEKMKMYYTLIANDMDLRYESISRSYPRFKLSVMINGFVYAKSVEDFPWVKKNVHERYLYDAENSLGVFARYQSSTMKKYPVYDHAMQFSRRDLVYFEKTWQVALLGIAFRGTTCYYPSSAVSVIEDSIYGNTGQIAAHELGHSLGAQHDSDAGCNDEEQYIMAAVAEAPTRSNSKNMWKMSDCSAKQIYHQLSRKGKTMCTLRNSYLEKSYEDIHSIQPGGRVYSLSKQCQLKFGSLSYTCQGPGKYICYSGIYCKSERYGCVRIPALSGSDCGANRICNKNRCIRLKKTKPTDIQSAGHIQAVLPMKKKHKNKNT